MKELIKRYLDADVSRRRLIKGLSAAGFSAVAADAFANSLKPVSGRATASGMFGSNFADANVPAGASTARDGASDLIRTVEGTGGQVFVQQLKAAGVKYYFFNPSTGDAPIFDALVNEPSIQLIKGVQEGTVVAMADGYARLSGKVGVCSVANVGLCNAMTQLTNAFKDKTPLLLVTAAFGQAVLGRDGPQDYDHQEAILQPLTKWYWLAQSADVLPETLRRALKFAATPPGGPVFLAVPENELKAHVRAPVMDQALFDVAMRVRADQAEIERVARMLIEAKSPLLTVGDEVTSCGGEREVVELAELLGLPVSGGGEFGVWSKPFPTRHPLYIGPTLREMRFPPQLDLRVDIGNPFGESRSPGATLVSIRRDPTSLARNSPVDLALISDSRLAARDLIDAVKSLAAKERLEKIAADRTARVYDYTRGMAQIREQILAAVPSSGNSPVHLERLGVELETGLDPDTIYVADVDSGKKMDPFMSFGGSAKTYVANGPSILGWGMGAAAGAKLAKPDRPVVSVQGDGAFLFGGPAPLWSQARYQIPVTNIVLNNRSYNNERNRIWSYAPGEQFRSGLDMTCYNGSPDVDFAKTAEAFGVEAESVKETSAVRDALARAKKANQDGRPYLLDIEINRDGIGAASEWYPAFSLADHRTRKV